MIELSSGGHRLLEPFWSPHNGYDAMSKQKGEKLEREDESGSKDYKVWTWWTTSTHTNKPLING